MNVRLPAWFMILLLMVMASLGGVAGTLLFRQPEQAEAADREEDQSHPYLDVDYRPDPYDRLDGLNHEVKLGLLRQAKSPGCGRTVDEMLGRMTRLVEDVPAVKLRPRQLDLAQESKTAYRLFVTVDIVADGEVGYDFAEWSVDAYDMTARPMNPLAEAITAGELAGLVDYARAHAGDRRQRGS